MVATLREAFGNSEKKCQSNPFYLIDYMQYHGGCRTKDHKEQNYACKDGVVYNAESMYGNDTNYGCIKDNLVGVSYFPLYMKQSNGKDINCLTIDEDINNLCSSYSESTKCSQAENDKYKSYRDRMPCMWRSDSPIDQ